jgi:hypothetical protein
LVLTLEVGLLCSLYTGEISLLRRGEAAIFEGLLSWVHNVVPEEVILEPSWDYEGWSLRSLEKREAPEIPWQLVELPLAPELFDGEQPQPAEYAILLSKLHQAGTREIAFTSELSWEEAPEIELVALDSALRPFQKILLPLPLSEVPQPDARPAWLRSSLIPRSSVVGDSSSLPIVNDVTFPPAVSAGEEITFAFTDFGGRDLEFRSSQRLPLVTRWEEDFLASWSLRLAMEVAGVEPSDLVIEPGRSLRLGTEGPVIPIDDFGRAKLPKTEDLAATPEMVSAKVLFPLSEGDLPEISDRANLIASIDQKAAARSERLWREARSLLAFPTPGRAEHFRRLGRGWELLLFLEIALVGIFALHVRSLGQLLGLLALCGGLAFLVLGLLTWKGIWTPILPLVAATTISWCLVGYLQQIAHPIRKRDRKKSPEGEASAAS